MILTKNEKEIMDLLWTVGRALTRAEIIELSAGCSWKASSIHILLNKMLDKGAIVVDGYVRTGKNFGRTFTYGWTEQEYQINQFKSGAVYHKGGQVAVLDYFLTLLNGEKFDKQTASKLKAMIDDKVVD